MVNRTFTEESVIRIKWSLHSFRNYISNSNLTKRIYIFAWILLILCFLFLIFIINPEISSALFLLILSLVLFKNKNFCFKAIKNSTESINILNLIFGVFVFFLVILYYKNLLNEKLIKNGLAIVLISSLTLFSASFFMEGYFFYKNKKDIIKPIISLLAAITSFISLFTSRKVVSYYTGVESSLFSTSTVILTISAAIFIWAALSSLILWCIYFFSLFISTILTPFLSFFYSAPILRNTMWYRFLFRKKEIKASERKCINGFIDWIFLILSRAIGASSIGLPICIIFYLLYQLLVFQNPQFHFIERIIVYADYRPSDKVTECININKEEWGLLLPNKKISIAKPQELGGYTFLTKSCIFEG